MKERESNIELLRILAIIGVIVLHYNNPSIGGGLSYVVQGNLNFYILYFLESLFICGVDLFILISGFFMSYSLERKLWKPVELIIQVMFFSLGKYILISILQHEQITIIGVLVSLVPDNYFVILYCVVYVLSLYVNIIFDKLKEKSRIFVLICFMIFSAYPTLIDFMSEIVGRQWNGLSSIGLYGSQWGYTSFNFLLMYIIGAYMRRYNIRIKKFTTYKLMLLLLACNVILVCWSRFNDFIGYFTEKSAWEYCNPVVILEAVIIFILFSRIRSKSIKMINILAQGAFSVFLLHDLFIPYIGIEKIVVGNAAIMVIHILASSILIYMVCWCINFICNLLMRPIYRKLSKLFPYLIIND
ncbi:MAG TPA: acyltransferase family protein [Candidatus Mediterraneibacter surreyensis]|nr:acyltransferase family protein [Candidatus Mediterraneibacter surreyensis]